LKSFNTLYKNENQLNQFIIDSKIFGNENILVQIFSGLLDEELLLGLAKQIKKQLPTSHILGTTTSGEIMNGKMYDEGICISFSVFEDTKIKSKIILEEDVKSVESLINNDTKVLIIFSDGLQSNGEKLVSCIENIDKNLIIGGGRAADNGQFQKTFIFNEERVLEKGFVVASLSSQKLEVHNNYLLNWHTLGEDMVVTKSHNGHVFEINHQKTIDIYEHYLGKEIVESLPLAAIEFPLIFEKHGTQVARGPIMTFDDGSILFAGNIDEGTKVKFGFGDVETIKNKSCENGRDLANYPIESIFVYSCSARKELMGKDLEVEFNVLSNLAPSVGFFTYGEFFHTKHSNELLNITTTFLALSESSEVKKHDVSTCNDTKIPLNKSLQALTHLVSTTFKELDKHFSLIESYEIAMNVSSIVTKSDLEGNITFVNDNFVKVSGYSRDEAIGKSHSLLRHPNTPKETFEELWKTIKSKKVWNGILQNSGKHGDYWINATILPLLDENEEIVEYMAIRHDITTMVNQKNKLDNIANTDPLTGLGNRYKLNNDIKASTSPALAILNIDSFSEINDFFGHEAGDEIIKKLGFEILKIIEKNRCNLYHLQGDEYVIFNPEISQNRFLSNISKFQEDINKVTLKINTEELGFDFTIGISFEAPSVILTTANMALKIAKKENKSFLIYSQSMSLNEEYKNNIKWSNKIKEAIKLNNFTPVFQPIVNNTNGKYEKYEALVRLKEGDKLISPYSLHDSMEH
jgi:diguanylate cyclase (GGDEF)-like protein/PAS domain S-box-containing protein